MDLQPVETILSEIGKAVRFFRYYPPAHPGVKRVMTDLGAVRERQAVPILADLAQSVSGVFQRRAVVVRRAAVRALGAIGTPDARAALARLRDDGTPDVRAAVLQALG